MTDRRTFLGMAFAAAAVPAARGAETGRVELPLDRNGERGRAEAHPSRRGDGRTDARPSGERRLRIGVVSDIHAKGDRNKDLAYFAKALGVFRDERVDCVALPGDMADDGQIEQLKMVADAWNATFPGGRLPDGSPVEKVFVYGNHDSSRLSYGIAQRNIRTAKALWGSEDEAKRHLVAYNEAAAWRECFGEEWEPIYAKTVKGYVFVGCSWGYEDRLPEWLAANAERLGLRGEKPFFYLQHPHPKGTCNAPHGEFAWGQDDGTSTKALSDYPSAIALSGHSHYPLTDDSSIWQGAFTSVNASSTAYLGRRDGRDNGSWDSHGRKGRKTGPVPVAKEPFHGRHAMVIDVYGDAAVFHRIDILDGGSLGRDWVVPLPACRGDAPYSFEAAEARSLAPEFAPGAEVSVSSRKGKDRSGRECDIVAVSFPAAKSSGDEGRIFEYEVTAKNVAYGIVRISGQKRVLSLAGDGAAGAERPDMREECLFRLDELPHETPVVFSVRPMNCFGVAGKAVESPRVRLPLE